MSSYLRCYITTANTAKIIYKQRKTEWSISLLYIHYFCNTFMPDFLLRIAHV